jgi:ferredoxin hydrogenase large subunit/hydrogenase large subunit
MATTITLDPVTRIEGHLSIRTEVQNGKVVRAYSSGEMFRGFEVILKGRDPLDAQQITQRICGVCPVSHGIASILAQDQAYQCPVPDNGRLVRNLILGAEYIHSHITHFYLLSAVDFVDIKAITQYTGKDPVLRDLRAWVEAELASHRVLPAAPFLPRYEGHYLQDTELNITAIRHYLDALEMRKLAHRMGALFCGKLPHAASLVPGGVTEAVTTRQIVAYGSMLKELRRFIDQVYLPDMLAVAGAFPDYFAMGKGCGNFLAYGAFPESSDGKGLFMPSGVLKADRPASLDPGLITEDVTCSRFSSPSGLHPSKGLTLADPQKKDAYSWIKAPRYQGSPMEVGPLARVLVACRSGHAEISRLVNDLLASAKARPQSLMSVMGRHAARAIECKAVADRCEVWLDQLKPDQPAFAQFTIPQAGSGAGLTEAPRGALGHWIEIAGRKIDRYQCIVPTTWNCSPRDANGQGGPVEQALEGTTVADANNPIEAARVVRSFDPCIACAVH